MAASFGIAKLCVCAAGGALIGGAAVHTVQKSKPRPRVAHLALKKPAAKPQAIRPAAAKAPVPLPCEPMMTPELSVRVPAALYGLPQQNGPMAQSVVFPISAALMPLEEQGVAAETGARLSEAADVPEPGTLGLLGLAVLGLAAVRRRA
jgi:hypothetical protein